MTRTPQIIVGLTAQGKLRIELPGPFATRRVVEVLAGHAEETMLRILRAQEQGKIDIGLDGSPTQAQTRHWERHEIWPQQSCRFCQAEGRTKADQGQGLRKGRKAIIFDRGDVQARIIPAKTKGKPKAQVAKATAQELGL
jgi:hypothetical protein